MPSGSRISIRFAFKSSFLVKLSTKGIMNSWPLSLFTISSGAVPAPKFTSTTVPTSRPTLLTSTTRHPSNSLT